ncbi:unnamed protein product [Pylaiella littoralis]
MAQSAGKMGLMALAALVPLAVLLGIATSGGSGVGRSGATFKAVDGVAGTGRRLTTSSSASDTASGQIDFATQLEMTLCLSPGHNTDSASSTDEQLKVAVMTVYGLEDADLVKVDTSLTKCTVDDWQRRVSIYNVADETGSAADIASSQVDRAYPSTNTKTFFEELVTSIKSQDGTLDFPGTDLDLVSLGFLVIWLDSSGDVVDTQASSTSKDVVKIAGIDVWWPWWAWLIYAGVVICCICPMLFFFFKWRRDKEAEMDYGGGSGKDMGGPPSATSSNPYGGNFAAEEHKSGKS